MIHVLNQNDEIIDYFDINNGDILEPDMVINVETLEDTLEFTIPSDRSRNVQDRNRVIMKDNEGFHREFIILQYESNIDGFTTVSCVGSHLEDFATAKPLKPQKLERYTTNQAIQFMAADTGWEVAPDNEWNGTRTTSWNSWKDRLSLLKQLQTTYEMRLAFYIDLGTNSVNKRYVKLKEINPMFNGEEIVYGENMIDLKRSVDFTEVATALVALGPEDEEGNRIIVELHDDEAQEQLGLPYRYLWQIYEPESEDTDMTEARLKTLARTKLNKIKEASVSYTIQSTQLNVAVGDMIRVKNEDFTPELYVEAEIIEIKYNAYTKLCDYKFGILTEFTREEVYEQFNKLLEKLRERLEKIKYDTEGIINERLEEELKDLERYIHKSPKPPLNPKEGDLWLDTSHGQVAVLKRYENGVWVKSSVSEAGDINAPTKEEYLYEMLKERYRRLNNTFINNYGLYMNLINNKYFIDIPQDIRDVFMMNFLEQSNAFTKFEADFKYVNEEQPTIGLIIQAMDSAIKFEEVAAGFSKAYADIREALDSYIEYLQRQYSEEKYLEALQEVADRIEGIEVVDGMLVGDIDVSKDVTLVLQEVKDDFLKDTVSREQYNTDITGIVEDLKHEQTERLQMADQIKDRVTIADYQAYKGEQAASLQTLETEISQNGQKILLKADAADLDSLDKTLSKKTAELEIEAGKIQGQVTGLNSDLAQAKADFKLTTDDIKLGVNANKKGIEDNEALIKVTSDNITSMVENRVSGGRNLLPNSDLPYDKDSWGTQYSTTGTSLHINNIRYTSYLWVNKDDSGTGTSLVTSSPKFDVVAGNELTISFKAVGFINAFEDMRYMSWIPTGQNNQAIAWENNIPRRKQIGTEEGNPVYLFEVTTTPNFTGEAYFILGTRRNDVTKPARFYVKDVMVEEGNTTSGWSPSPKDNADKWTKIEQTTENILTEVGKKVGNNEIISRINQTAETVKIDAGKIELTAGSELRLAVEGLNGLAGSANMLLYTQVTDGNLKHFTNINGGTNVDTIISTLDGFDYFLSRALSSQTPSYVAITVNRYANPMIKWRKGKNYKLSFKARKSAGTQDLTYTYIMRVDGANQNLGTPTRITPSEGVNEFLYEFDITPNWDSDEGYILIGTRPDSGAYDGYWIRVRDVMLQEGTVATGYVPNTKEIVGVNNVVPSINLDESNVRITGKKIALDGYTTMTQAFADKLEVNKLVSTSKQDTFTLIGGDVKLERSNGQRMTMAIEGIYMYNSNGSIRFQIDEHMVTSAALGTSNANVYLGASNGYEVRFVERDSLPSDGLAASYTYVDARGKKAYFEGISNNQTNNLDLGADGFVRIMNKGHTTLNTLWAAGIRTDFIDLNASGNSSDHLYLRTRSEVRITKNGTTTGYLDLRAAKGYFDSLWSHRYAHLNLRVDNEVRLIAHGDTQTYRDIRGLFAYFDALDVNTGSHLYLRPSSGSEVRVTRTGSTTAYGTLRANRIIYTYWEQTSLESMKTKIKPMRDNVLDIYRNELELYQFAYNEEPNKLTHGVVIGKDYKVPKYWLSDGKVKNNEVLWHNTKAIQELANENDEKEVRIQKLEKEVNEMYEIIKKLQA